MKINRSYVLFSGVVVALLGYLVGCVGQGYTAELNATGTNATGTKMYLVFKVSCDPGERAQGEDITATFLYKTAGSSCTPEDVLRNGMYFRSLSRALAYLASLPEDEQLPLEYESLQYLTAKLPMFEEFPQDIAVAEATREVTAPDVAVNTEQIPHYAMFATLMRYGNGGVVYAGPSGVPIDERWALMHGTYVPNLREIIEDLERERQIIVFPVDGRTLNGGTLK